MKKIKDLFFIHSQMNIFAVVFSLLALTELVVSIFVPFVRFVLFPQGAMFLHEGILCACLLANDQKFSFLLLPLNGKTIIKAKILQITAAELFITVFLSIILICSHSVSGIENLNFIFFLIFILFPIISAASIFYYFAILLSGNYIITIISYVIFFGMPGFISGISRQIWDNKNFTFYAEQMYQRGTLSVIFISIYLVSIIFTFFSYKLGLRNFKKLQYNKTFNIGRQGNL